MTKVVLAFSGGLDTTYCAKYLQEEGYEVITVTVDTGGFSEAELECIGEKAKSIGSTRHYTIDAKQRLFESIVKYVIMGNALYEDSYPHMCSDRYIISEIVAEIAKKENTSYVAHGSTGQGNDQVRFDAALMCIDNSIKIITPIREKKLSRDAEIRYLENRGINVDKTAKKYSVNENIFGRTISGSEIDNNKEPAITVFKLTAHANDDAKIQAEYAEIEFSKGIPVALNRKKMSGASMLQKLNSIAGKQGIGQGIYIGNCIIGVKGRIAFECPGITTLIGAHKALEQLILTKHQMDIKRAVAYEWSNLIYTGKYFDPAVRDINAFFETNQQQVTGLVKLRLHNGTILPVEVKSDNSLIRKDIAVYAQSSSWSSEDAVGFIKLFSMQQKIANSTKGLMPQVNGRDEDV